MKKTKFIDFIEKLEKFKLHTRIIMFATIVAIICFMIYMLYYINSYVIIGELNSGQYLEVLSNDLVINISIFTVTLVASFIFIYINNKIAIKIIKSMGKREGKEVGKIPNKSLAFLFSLVVSFIATEVLKLSLSDFLNTTNFVVKDPIFDKDISYYIMQRPFMSLFTKFIGGYLIAVLLYLIGYYTACFGYYFDGVDSKNKKQSNWLKHIITIICIYLTLNIMDTFFYKESILYTNLNVSSKSLFTKLVGSGFTDVNIKLVYFKILPYLLIAFIVIGIILYKKKKYKHIVAIPVAYLGYTVITYILIALVQSIYVEPNELMLEKKYVQYHLDYTKKAYGIDLDKKDIYIEKSFTDTDIETYRNVIENLDIMEKSTFINKLNSDKDSYVKYSDVDNIIKNVNGKKTLAYLTAEEMASEKLLRADYINKNIKYVYGNGVLAFTPNVLEGAIDDITDKIVQNDQKIYYGESTELDAIVNPIGMYQTEESSVVEQNYKGKNGLSMNKLNRINIAIKNLDLNAIFAKYIDKNSKYLITRNIIERVQLVFESMLVDKNPYIVLDENGKAYYVVDVYTIAEDYPYSKSINIDKNAFAVKKAKVDLSKVNYIRNSIKVLVDPYDGTLRIYNTDKTDPLAISYAKKYPKLFNKEDELYQDLKEDFKYPQALMDIQVEILKEYYLDYAESFYKNENILKLPSYIDANNNKVEIKSYYTFATTDEENLILMQPISYSSENLAGYFTGTVKDGRNKISMYKFDSSNKVLGMIQLDQQIQATNKKLKEDLENIKAKRNSIIKKVMFVPMDNKLLYLQIYYSTSIDYPGDAVIEKIVISDGKKICVENTLSSAIKKIAKVGEDEVSEELLGDEISVNIEQVIKTYKYMRDTLKQGDFEMFGREFQNLDSEIQKLEQKYEEQKLERVDIEE